MTHATDIYAPYLSLLGFKLEESALYKIKEELGDATIKQSGSVTKSDFSICYTSGKIPSILTLMKCAEVGGTEDFRT